MLPDVPQLHFADPISAAILLPEKFDGLALYTFKLACKWYPAKKAKGIDNWDSKLLLALPDEVLMTFLVWFRL